MNKNLPDFTTRKGDNFKTTLTTNEKVYKNDYRIIIIGIFDELQANNLILCNAIHEKINSYSSYFSSKKNQIYTDFLEFLNLLNDHFYVMMAYYYDKNFFLENKDKILNNIETFLANPSGDIYGKEIKINKFIVPDYKDKIIVYINLLRTLIRKCETYCDEISDFFKIINRLSDAYFLMILILQENF